MLSILLFVDKYCEQVDTEQLTWSEQQQIERDMIQLCALQWSPYTILHLAIASSLAQRGKARAGR